MGTRSLKGLYKEWFLDYASYVILERAVPALYDGFKPVQRRILHAMYQMNDGRFHKVANIIGQTMQFHPHGDASIGDALVHIGQKNLMIDTQGNWGDVRTGDRAAAPRYIEARLSKFALEVGFNPKITEWKLSYDGRKNEPILLPVKFPILLAHGVEGIAVGLATKILPHNFLELIDASINILRNQSFEIYPDFETGGFIDVENYNEGVRGGKLLMRADIQIIDKNTLQINSVPYGVTTGSLIDSIIKANDKGKIKIKHITDNTAKDINVTILLHKDVSPDITIDALYAFTDCQTSISPNACVIVNETPVFLSVRAILKQSTLHTVDLLRQELEFKLNELKEKLLFSSLERIFIENRIYRDIEECETWEAVIEAIDKGITPFKPQFYRTITEEDLVRLTEIKIKRISKFDSFKADEAIKNLEDKIAEIEHHLKHLTKYAIAYFKSLAKKYGAGKERKSVIKGFDEIKVKQVVIANQKLFVNMKEGFIGTGIKKDKFVCDCSDIDDVIVFKADGNFIVTKVADKTFVGKNIIHVGLWKKSDVRRTYNVMYVNGTNMKNYAKRFNVTAITRDKNYEFAKGGAKSKVLFFSAQPNAEADVVQIKLSPNCRARNKVFQFDFSAIEIKGKGSQGNIVTRWPIKNVTLHETGKSTLGGRKVFYDKDLGKINFNERGDLVGVFDTNDLLLIIYRNGSFELKKPDPIVRFDIDLAKSVEKFIPKSVISCIYYDGERSHHYIKRFVLEGAIKEDHHYHFISEHAKSKPVLILTDSGRAIDLTIAKGKKEEKEIIHINIDEFIDVKGLKSLGNRLSVHPVVNIDLLEKKVVEKVNGENDDSIDVGDSIEWESGNQGRLF